MSACTAERCHICIFCVHFMLYHHTRWLFLMSPKWFQGASSQQNLPWQQHIKVRSPTQANKIEFCIIFVLSFSSASVSIIFSCHAGNSPIGNEHELLYDVFYIRLIKIESMSERKRTKKRIKLRFRILYIIYILYVPTCITIILARQHWIYIPYGMLLRLLHFLGMNRGTIRFSDTSNAFVHTLISESFHILKH